MLFIFRSHLPMMDRETIKKSKRLNQADNCIGDLCWDATLCLYRWMDIIEPYKHRYEILSRWREDRHTKEPMIIRWKKREEIKSKRKTELRLDIEGGEKTLPSLLSLLHKMDMSCEKTIIRKLIDFILFDGEKWSKSIHRRCRSNFKSKFYSKPDLLVINRF